MAESDKALEKLADNVGLRLFGRVSMVVATTIVLPTAPWLGSRGVATIDEIARKLDGMKEQAIEQAGEIRSLRQLSKTQQQILADHEGACARARARGYVCEAAGRAGRQLAAENLWAANVPRSPGPGYARVRA